MDNWRTNEEYKKRRDVFLHSNEGYRETAYFDPVGIATILNGIALVARNGGTNDARRFTKHTDNLKTIKDFVSNDSYEEIEDFANENVAAINRTPEPVYNGKKTVAKFEATERGQQVTDTFDHLNKKWEAANSPKISKEEAAKISESLLSKKEAELDRLLIRIGISPDDLSINQRIALFDAFYQGRWPSGGKKAALKIKTHAIASDVCKELYSTSQYSKYKARIDKECKLIDPYYVPPKRRKKKKDKLQPQNAARDPILEHLRKGFVVHEWMGEIYDNSLFRQFRDIDYLRKK